MGLFTQDFLAERREDFMNRIVTFEYEVNNGEMWLPAVEEKRTIDGNNINFTLLLPNTLQSAHSITGLRLLDIDNEIIAQRDLSIDISVSQTVLLVLRIIYQEV